jgi:predicted RNase H-like nuclease
LGGPAAAHSARFLGLDLAWKAGNPSGVAALDERGHVIDVRWGLHGDRELLGWIRSHLACGRNAAIGIDMPTIVPNESGRRPCEGALQAEFHRRHAGPHPANRALLPGGGRARALLDALAGDRVLESLTLRPREAGRFAFEVYPHPALVRLFGRERIFEYKKKRNRGWPRMLDEWAAYRAALATLETADPALFLGDWIPPRAERRGYKEQEDRIDAVTCAYIAAFVWRWGTSLAHVQVFGDLETGYIIVPNRQA